MTEPPRLYYLDDIPTPYRLEVHRRVGEIWPGVFKLAFCAASEPGRAWDIDLSGLDAEVLPGLQYRPKRQVNPMSIKWNSSVLRSLQAFQPDVVAVSGYSQPTVHLATAWCRARGVPYGVSCETSLRDTTMEGARASLKKLVAGWVVGGMAFGLPVGSGAARYLEQLGAGDAPMFLFPNTPNAAAIATAAEQVRHAGVEQSLRQELGIRPRSKIVLFVGRMIDAKRPMDLLEAFRRIDAEALDAWLVFVGGGPLLSRLRASASEAARVIFTDWIREPERVFALMASASVFVLPSQHEPWGAVVNEAMASGVAVVASDRVGAALELIETQENGVIFPVGDLQGLASAIQGLLADEVYCERVRRAGQATAIRQGHDFAARNLVNGANYALNSDGTGGASPSAKSASMRRLRTPELFVERQWAKTPKAR